MGTHNFSEMSAVLNRYAKSIGPNSAKAMRTIALAGYDEAVDSTPVKTGTAASNWNISLGAPDASVRGTLGAGAKGAVKSIARARLAALTETITIFITNAVHYLRFLEYGSPTTIAHNMTARGVQKMRQAAKTVKILKQL